MKKQRELLAVIEYGIEFQIKLDDIAERDLKCVTP